ncbi:hypothetical protein [Roseobacter weihaiensis]|uniref:hypothetical protein n=1 Tax=Roseobacter weihaiensis TaxID=2763262 RepID=UPI001D0B3C07|nr:hypothetical protein [Roseobacter sp. H9]
MRRWLPLVSAAAICATSALAAQAAETRAALSNQGFQSGQVTRGHSVGVSALANCPQELRGMYRGDLYCRNPTYQLLGQRHPLCPPGFFGMYRGSLYCFGRG